MRAVAICFNYLEQEEVLRLTSHKSQLLLRENDNSRTKTSLMTEI